MIKYNLKCKNKHEFESWFADSREFEKLRLKKLIECAFCGSKSVEKSIMSPRVLNKEEEISDKKNKEIKKVHKDLLKIRNFVEKNFKYVGDNFPREVRNIYYDEKNKRNIYGNATQEEIEELSEEGIELATIPWVEKKDN
tara:strand:- start:312 stop:731 length:420 start_codon:yes stop_codon:yes gene_type:complete